MAESVSYTERLKKWDRFEVEKFGKKAPVTTPYPFIDIEKPPEYRGIPHINPEKCIGCGACVNACPPDALILEWDKERGVKRLTFNAARCIRCHRCVEVCPTKALHIDPETGAVVWDGSKCIGCGYCEVACPFGIIKLNAELKTIEKCTFCVDRIKNGIPPACAQACPTGALYFASYEEVRAKAEELEREGRYVYGLREVGGTRYMIALPKGVKPEDVGLPSPKTGKPVYAISDTGKEDYRGYAERVFGEWAGIGVIGGLILAGLVKMRERGKKGEGEKGKGEGEG